MYLYVNGRILRRNDDQFPYSKDLSKNSEPRADGIPNIYQQLDHLSTGLLDQELIMFIINRFGGTRADNVYHQQVWWNKS